MTNKIKVKIKKEFEKKIKEYRQLGYMLITLWKRFAELENSNEIIVIEY